MTTNKDAKARADAARAERAEAIAASSPWLVVKTEGAAYVRRGGRFLAREVTAGRLKAARIGCRGELIAKREWLDAWVEEHATPIVVMARRRGS